MTKLPGRTPASAGMNSPPELASKIVTLTMSPMPKRMSFGRLRSGNSAMSRGTAFPKMLATLDVIRTKAYGTLLGSCCPAHTSQLSGPLAGINAQPPAATSEPKSAKLNRMPRPRTVALPPTQMTLTHKTMRDQRGAWAMKLRKCVSFQEDVTAPPHTDGHPAVKFMQSMVDERTTSGGGLPRGNKQRKRGRYSRRMRVG